MVHKNLNAHQGYHPRTLEAPSNAIPPKQVLRHHRDKRRGDMGGQALSPPQSYRCFVFHIMVKGILPSLFLHRISLQLMLNSL